MNSRFDLNRSVVLLMAGSLVHFVFGVGSPAAEPIAGLAALENKLVSAIDGAEGSVVALAVLESMPESPIPLDADPFEFISRSGAGRIPSRFGSGVIIERNTADNVLLVLTNEHLIRQSRRSGEPPRPQRIAIRTEGRHTMRATVHAADPRSDLAVLRVDLDDSGLRANEFTALPFGDVSSLNKGSLVIALGNPSAIARDGSCSASLGIISNLARSPVSEKRGGPGDEPIHALGMLLHVDVRLELGASGGALINLEGALIGLTTSLAAIEGYDRPGGFAIPMTSGVKRIIAALKQGYEVEYGFLGVTPDTTLPGELQPLKAFVTQPSAARINRVAKGAPADQAGLRPDDIVLKVNGIPVYSGNDLVREVGLLGPGTQVDLSVFRTRQREFETLTVTLGKWPIYDDSNIIATAERHPAWRGLKVDYPTGRRRYLPSSFLTEYYRAVVVADVKKGSAADQAGLKVGQFVAKVDGKGVETPDEFYRAVNARTGKVVLTLQKGEAVEVPDDNLRN